MTTEPNERRTFAVEGNLAKAHLVLYLISRFDCVSMRVDRAQCAPHDIPGLLMFHLEHPLCIKPLTVTTACMTGEIRLRDELVEVRVPWEAVYWVSSGSEEYEVDDPPADEAGAAQPAKRPLTIVRGGKA